MKGLTYDMCVCVYVCVCIYIYATNKSSAKFYKQFYLQ